MINDRNKNTENEKQGGKREFIFIIVQVHIYIYIICIIKNDSQMQVFNSFTKLLFIYPQAKHTVGPQNTKVMVFYS